MKKNGIKLSSRLAQQKARVVGSLLLRKVLAETGPDSLVSNCNFAESSSDTPGTLPETNSKSSENRSNLLQKEMIVFQPSIFRGEHVSFRERSFILQGGLVEIKR